MTRNLAIGEAYMAGALQKDLALKYGISKCRVQQIISGMGLPTAHEKAAVRRKHMAVMVGNGGTISEVASACRVSAVTVHNACDEHGVSRPSLHKYGHLWPLLVSRVEEGEGILQACDGNAKKAKMLRKHLKGLGFKPVWVKQ